MGTTSSAGSLGARTAAMVNTTARSGRLAAISSPTGWGSPMQTKYSMPAKMNDPATYMKAWRAPTVPYTEPRRKATNAVPTPVSEHPATYSASPAWADADQATTNVASVAIPASTVTDSRDSTMRAVTFWNAPATMSTRPSAVVEARYVTDMALPPTEAPDQPNSTSLL